ncbi:MAG: type I DNA topoisomerase [Candidatus Sericytochromatia bacterium]|nr:type I DNA topoisomerase [Candidatus Sericytochromatia bacterium]
MAKNLVIVESPAKAKTIEKILGKDFAVKASAGHVRDLPKKGIGVDVRKNFAPKYEVLPDKLEKVKELQQAAHKAKTIYLAPDPDREGEAIAWHLASILADTAAETGASLKRIEFNEITKDAIQRAIKKPRDIDLPRVDAQQARRVLDRLVGYKISPLLWIKVKRGLSAGRVQSVAVRLICDREKEVQAFVPQEYWTIAVDLAAGKSVFATDLVRWQGRRISSGKKEQDKAKDPEAEKGDGGKELVIADGLTAQRIQAALEAGTAKVARIVTKESKRQPTPPFITSTLQQEGSRRFGFTVKRTMALAQQLYEGIELGAEGPVGLITYMRTDSIRVAKEAQEEAAGFVTSTWGADYLPTETRAFKSKKGAQDAHEAIRPSSVLRTPESLKKVLKPDQWKLYSLIWQRFLASQMSNALLSTLSVDIEVAEGVLRVTDTKVLFAGYQKVYEELSEDEEAPADALPPAKLPDLKEGQALTVRSVQPRQHFTQPPPRFTEASLVKAMEAEGIGRPSTYAPTIATIQDRGYVVKEGRALQPTELGNAVNSQLVLHFPEIVDLKFTADMENKLDGVETGGEPWQSLIGNFYKPFNETLKKAAKEMEAIAIPSGEFCDACGKEFVIKSGRYGDFLACSGYPECANKKPYFKKIGMTCPTCAVGDVIEKRSRMGKTFYGCQRWPDCNFTTWDLPTDQRCEKCQSVMVLKRMLKTGRTYLKCSVKECGHTSYVVKKKAADEAQVEGEQPA